jgi:large subunit ribosomal protein L35
MSSKMKSNRSAAKRLKVTRSGKVRRYKAGKGHLLSKKSGKRRRNLRKPGLVHKGQEKTAQRLLGRE